MVRHLADGAPWVLFHRLLGGGQRKLLAFTSAQLRLLPSGRPAGDLQIPSWNELALVREQKPDTLQVGTLVRCAGDLDDDRPLPVRARAVLELCNELGPRHLPM